MLSSPQAGLAAGGPPAIDHQHGDCPGSRSVIVAAAEDSPAPRRYDPSQPEAPASLRVSRGRTWVVPPPTPAGRGRLDGGSSPRARSRGASSCYTFD